jgi:hypothetical protein
MNKKILAMMAFAALFFVTACGDDEEPTPSCVTTNLTYTKDTKAILSGCAAAGCHVAGSPLGSLATYADTKAYIITAKAAGRFDGAINHQTGFSPMPKGGSKLSDCNISKLNAWINAGMPE